MKSKEISIYRTEGALSEDKLLHDKWAGWR